MEFMDLPNEIFIELFRYLSEDEVIFNMSLVSKKFNEICNLEISIKYLCLSRKKFIQIDNYNFLVDLEKLFKEKNTWKNVYVYLRTFVSISPNDNFNIQYYKNNFNPTINAKGDVAYQSLKFNYKLRSGVHYFKFLYQNEASGFKKAVRGNKFLFRRDSLIGIFGERGAISSQSGEGFIFRPTCGHFEKQRKESLVGKNKYSYGMWLGSGRLYHNDKFIEFAGNEKRKSDYFIEMLIDLRDITNKKLYWKYPNSLGKWKLAFQNMNGETFTPIIVVQYSTEYFTISKGIVDNSILDAISLKQKALELLNETKKD